MPDTRIFLTELPTRLRAYLGEASPNYRRCYNMVLDGTIAMQREPGTKSYHCAAEDLPVIVEAVRRIIARKTAARLARQPRRVPVAA